MGDSVDDLELWKLWQNGDRDSGDRLVRRHFLAIHRFFQTKIPEAADELTQHTFLAALEVGARFEARSSVRAYLFGIARKQLLRYLEGRGFRMRDDASLHTSIAEVVTSPSGAAERLEERARVLEAMRSIPVDHQIVIELFYWEELSVAEIGEALEIPAGTVKSRLSRAKDALRRKLKAPGTTSQGEDLPIALRELAAALSTHGSRSIE